MKKILLPALLITALAFLSGFYLGKNQTGTVAGTVADSNTPVFAVEPNSQPQLDFYVMSFCPYGNQIEDVIKPVYNLLGDKVTLQPRYIFEKITDLDSYCSGRSGDPEKCPTYIESGYFTNEEDCQDAIAQSLSSCLDTSAYIEANGVYYASLHGRVEANQDVREICAYNLTDDKTKWWDFIEKVNNSCDSQNADTCWEDQASSAGLDTTAIKDCFNNDAFDLIEKEVALTEQNKVSGSPTLFINGVQFPPESGYAQDGSGKIKVGDYVIDQDKYRHPNGLKQAICGSFKKEPKECQTEIDSTTTTSPEGGC